MSAKTPIEWTNFSWNFVRGCTEQSLGCVNCYARGIAYRFGGEGAPFHGLTFKSPKTGKVRWTGKIMFVEKDLDVPLRKKSPLKIFVNSMSDCFHENVDFDWLDRAFAVMQKANWHIYQILTKQPARMLEYIEHWELHNQASFAGTFPHVWMGVSVEDQKRADERIPLLIRANVAVRFLSCEPLLEVVNITDRPQWDWRYTHAYWKRAFPEAKPQIDWIIAGGESGLGARPMPVEAVTQLAKDCEDAGVAFFFKQTGKVLAKQWGLKNSKGGDLEEISDDMLPAFVKVRQFPEAVR